MSRRGKGPKALCAACGRRVPVWRDGWRLRYAAHRISRRSTVPCPGSGLMVVWLHHGVVAHQERAS